MKNGSLGIFLFVLFSCSVIGDNHNTVRQDEGFDFKSPPLGWQKKSSAKAQHYFTNEEGAVFYANSYCDYYSQPLKEVALKHIKQLGDVRVEKQSSFSTGNARGIYSEVFSKYQDRLLSLRHFGVKVGNCYYDLNGISPATGEIEHSFKHFIKAMEL